MGADPALVPRGASRRHSPLKPLGLEYHHRQGRVPPWPVSNQSARCLAAYLYTAAGTGESTTDLAWDGHAIIYENGALLAESARFNTPHN